MEKAQEIVIKKKAFITKQDNIADHYKLDMKVKADEGEVADRERELWDGEEGVAQDLGTGEGGEGDTASEDQEHGALQDRGRDPAHGCKVGVQA